MILIQSTCHRHINIIQCYLKTLSIITVVPVSGIVNLKRYFVMGSCVQKAERMIYTNVSLELHRISFEKRLFLRYLIDFFL